MEGDLCILQNLFKQEINAYWKSLAQGRVDPVDCIAYTWKDFHAYYSNRSEQEIKEYWKTLVQRRVDPADGTAYTWTDFHAYYSKWSKQRIKAN